MALHCWLISLGAQDLRGGLTSNRTFSHLSWHYGIPRELIFSQRDDSRKVVAQGGSAHCRQRVRVALGRTSCVRRRPRVTYDTVAQAVPQGDPHSRA